MVHFVSLHLSEMYYGSTMANEKGIVQEAARYGGWVAIGWGCYMSVGIDLRMRLNPYCEHF